MHAWWLCGIMRNLSGVKVARKNHTDARLVWKICSWATEQIEVIMGDGGRNAEASLNS